MKKAYITPVSAVTELDSQEFLLVLSNTFADRNMPVECRSRRARNRFYELEYEDELW